MPRGRKGVISDAFSSAEQQSSAKTAGWRPVSGWRPVRRNAGPQTGRKPARKIVPRSGYLGLPSGLVRMVPICCLIVGIMSLLVTAGRGLRMWEDFMRGNWPAVAPAVPAPRTAPEVVESATLRERQPGGAALLGAPVYAVHAGPMHAKPVHHATGPKRFAVRTVVTASAGLLLAVVLPGSAIAGSVHSAAHGTHAAVVSRP
jgi:hypothetical protein